MGKDPPSQRPGKPNTGVKGSVRKGSGPVRKGSAPVRKPPPPKPPKGS